MEQNGLLDFLTTKTSKEDLVTTLRVLEEFKGHESKEEWMYCSFDTWVKLEQFEDYLRILTNTKVEEVGDEVAKNFFNAQNQ